MAIDYIIPSQSFELIRDRIALILGVELLNQYTLTSDERLNVGVWLERFTPYDQSELPAVNVMLESLRVNQRNPSRCVYDGRYSVEVYCSSEDIDSERGDAKSSVNCQFVAGKVRFILENPTFLRLGFTSSPSIVANTQIQDITISRPNEMDGRYTTMIQLILAVRLEELNGDLLPIPAEGYDAVAKLDNTEKGIKITLNNS